MTRRKSSGDVQKPHYFSDNEARQQAIMLALMGQYAAKGMRLDGIDDKTIIGVIDYCHGEAARIDDALKAAENIFRSM